MEYYSVSSSLHWISSPSENRMSPSETNSLCTSRSHKFTNENLGRIRKRPKEGTKEREETDETKSASLIPLLECIRRPAPGNNIFTCGRSKVEKEPLGLSIVATTSM